jgi:hypothetical protein
MQPFIAALIKVYVGHFATLNQMNKKNAAFYKKSGNCKPSFGTITSVDGRIFQILIKRSFVTLQLS